MTDFNAIMLFLQQMQQKNDQNYSSLFLQSGQL